MKETFPLLLIKINLSPPYSFRFTLQWRWNPGQDTKAIRRHNWMQIFNNLAVRSIEAQCQDLRGSSSAVQIISPSWKFFVPQVSRVGFCDYIYEKSWLAGSIDFEFMLGEWWFCYLVRLYLNHCRAKDWIKHISLGISKNIFIPWERFKRYSIDRSLLAMLLTFISSSSLSPDRSFSQASSLWNMELLRKLVIVKPRQTIYHFITWGLTPPPFHYWSLIT